MIPLDCSAGSLVAEDECSQTAESDQSFRNYRFSVFMTNEEKEKRKRVQPACVVSDESKNNELKG